VTLAVGGQPLVTLTAPDPAPGAGGFIRAVIAPGRAMMLLTLTAKQADGREVEVIDCPPLEDAARRLNDRPAYVFGNAAFAFGGAILAPFANRIRGRADGEAILVDIEGRQVRLPANWSGKAPGAERYAMHGLMLAAAAHTVETGGGSTVGRVILDDPARWPSRLEM
jgi:hypothetical protein